MVSSSNRSDLGPLAAALRRVVEGIGTAWAAVSLTFLSLRLAVRDPVAGLLSQGLATREQADLLRHTLGLDVPLIEQYGRFLTGLLRADLGLSLYTQRPVTAIILEQLPATFRLASLAFLIAVLIGIALGILSAWKGGAWEGEIADAASGLFTALPVSFTGILALFLLRLNSNWMSIIGPASPARLLLPALVLGIASSGAIARVIRASLSESLAAPYILAARARGLRRNARLLWHALRPALPPAISLSALEAAFLFGGTVVTETVFSRPGLGRLLVLSILQGDYPIAQGVVVLSAVFYTTSHVLADLIAFALDPRLRRQP